MVRQAWLYALQCMNDDDLNALAILPQLAIWQYSRAIATMLCLFAVKFIVWYVVLAGLTVAD